MLRRVKVVPLALAVALFAALAAAAAFSAASVSYRSAERDGHRVGEVLIGDQVVIVLRTSAGGYVPLERAEVVASRLRAALGEELGARDIEVMPVAGGSALYIGDRLIVTANQAEADAQGATPEALASLWRSNILGALGIADVSPEAPASGQEATPSQEPAPSQGQTAKPAAATGDSIDWTGTAQKWVPIFSLETEGAYIGAAQVAGPPAQVAKVKGVAELRLNFQNIGRIFVYVPVSTISLTKLDRVQGVSVWATGDIGLVRF